MKLTQFDKAALQLMRKDIDAALKIIAEKYGIESLSMGNSSIASTEFTAKIIGKIGQENSLIAAAHNRGYSIYLGYSENIIGRSFTIHGKTFTVTEINPRKQKMPIIAKNEKDGRLFEFNNELRLPFADQTLTWTKPSPLTTY